MSSGKKSPTVPAKRKAAVTPTREERFFLDVHCDRTECSGAAHQSIEIVRRGKAWGVRFIDDGEETEYTHWMVGEEAAVFMRACGAIAAQAKPRKRKE